MEAISPRDFPVGISEPYSSQQVVISGLREINLQSGPGKSIGCEFRSRFSRGVDAASGADLIKPVGLRLKDLPERLPVRRGVTSDEPEEVRHNLKAYIPGRQCPPALAGSLPLSEGCRRPDCGRYSNQLLRCGPFFRANSLPGWMFILMQICRPRGVGGIRDKKAGSTHTSYLSHLPD